MKGIKDLVTVSPDMLFRGVIRRIMSEIYFGNPALYTDRFGTVGHGVWLTIQT
jgi:hypothetical protein